MPETPFVRQTPPAWPDRRVFHDRGGFWLLCGKNPPRSWNGSLWGGGLGGLDGANRGGKRGDDVLGADRRALGRQPGCDAVQVCGGGGRARRGGGLREQRACPPGRPGARGRGGPA